MSTRSIEIQSTILRKKSDCKRLYKLLRQELANRIKELENSDNDLKKAFIQDFGKDFTPDDVIDFYAVTLHEEMIERRRYCAKRQDLADFYFLSRVISSCCNTALQSNTFNAYFGCFRPSEKVLKTLEKFEWIKREESKFENNYWDYMLKLLLSEQLEQDRSGLSSVLCNFNIKELKNKTPEDLLDDFRRTAKENIRKYNAAMWRKADVQKFEPKSYNFEIFEEDEARLFPHLSKALIQACEAVERLRGSRAWLKSLDRKLNVPNPEVDEVMDGIGIEKWKGFNIALSQDFFKDMGFAHFCKADRHIIKVLEELRIISPDSKEKEKYVFESLNYMASQIDNDSVTANHIDKIIWLLKSGRFYKHCDKGHPLDPKGQARTLEMCNRIYNAIKK